MNVGFTGEAGSVKPLLDRDSKEMKYFCKKNHPGKDCERNFVECNFCYKRGHREYECYIKKGSGNQQPGEQHQQRNQNKFGRQGNQQTEGGHHGNNG